MIHVRFYKIADIIFEFRLHAFDVDLCEEYGRFSSEVAVPDYIIDCYIVDNFEIQGERVRYWDHRNLIYECDGRVLRFIGTFQNPGELFSAFARLHYINEVQLKLDLRSFGLKVRESKLFDAVGMEYLLLMKKRLILHSSFIAVRNKAIVFTAPSGTGKSTQAQLWKEYNEQTVIVNGDRSILFENNSKIYAAGLPFCGSSEIALNHIYLLQTIVILRQGKSNCITKLSPSKALAYLISECCVSIWDRRGTEILMDLLSHIVFCIPVYIFYCVPDTSAVEVLNQKLLEERYD